MSPGPKAPAPTTMLVDYYLNWNLHSCRTGPRQVVVCVWAALYLAAGTCEKRYLRDRAQQRHRPTRSGPRALCPSHKAVQSCVIQKLWPMAAALVGDSTQLRQRATIPGWYSGGWETTKHPGQ